MEECNVGVPNMSVPKADTMGYTAIMMMLVMQNGKKEKMNTRPTRKRIKPLGILLKQELQSLLQMVAASGSLIDLRQHSVLKVK